MNPLLAYFLLLGLLGLLGFIVSIRDVFKRHEQAHGEELCDYLHNDWLREKNLICYGRERWTI